MSETIKLDRKEEMQAYMENFRNMPDRLLKYNEILLEGEDASPECYQDTMSYRRLAVALTTRCNLTCKWCYRFDPLYQSVLNRDLDFKVFQRFVKNTKSRFRMVHFGGLGEPSMYLQIKDAIRLAKELSSNIKITSNGVLLTHDLVNSYVDAGLTHIEISIDAFHKDKLAEYRGVDLSHLIDLITYISNNLPLHLQINTVISNLNYPWLANFVSVFKEAKNINVWHTIRPFLTYQTRKEGIGHISLDEYQNFLSRIEKEIIKEGLKWKLDPSSNGVRLDPVIEMKKKRNICFSCFEDPYISVNGRFNFCSRQEFSSVADISVGFEKAWNHPSLLKFRENMLGGIYPKYCGQLCSLKDRSTKDQSNILTSS
jgi:MoaA/NifB/PqqE/SkfB family radical SAM enzyme